MPSRLAAYFLADKQRSGIYRLPQGWTHDPSDPALCWKTLAQLPAIDRESLLAALGATLAFPAYYGQNWDAAWDCLTELDWPARQLLVIHLPIAADSTVVAADLEIFLELLGDACQHWADRDHALCLLIEAQRTDLPALQALPDLDS